MKRFTASLALFLASLPLSSGKSSAATPAAPTAKDEPPLEPVTLQPLNRPMARRIFDQGQMCAEVVVIAGVGLKDPTQRDLAKDDGVIKAFPADRADQSLRMPVLPR